MTRGERENLAKLVRRRERVAKSDARARSAVLLSDGEAQLAHEFSAQDEAWKTVIDEVQIAVEKANAQIGTRCDELGIPQEFRPSMHKYFFSRGENAVPARRAELRKVLQTRVAEIEKQAVAAIERRSLAVQEQLALGGLESDEARALFESLPTIESLMPTITPAEITDLSAGRVRLTGGAA